MNSYCDHLNNPGISHDFTLSLMDLFDENREVDVSDLESEIQFNEELIESAQKTDALMARGGAIFFTGTCAADLAASLLWSLNLIPAKFCILVGFSGGTVLVATGIFLGCYTCVNDGKIQRATYAINELRERKKLLDSNKVD